MDEEQTGTPETPAVMAGPGPLTAAERMRALLAGLLPIPAVALVLVPIAAWSGATAGDVAGAAVIYGGLLGLASTFVMIDRLHRRQCPRCRTRNGRGVPACRACGYDLAERPRYGCTERHRVYVEPGLCECGRRLEQLDVARGIGRELVFVLKVGAWLLAFLIGVGLLLRMLGP